MALDPIIGGAIIGGAADLVGGLIGGASSAHEARKQREWEKRMYESRYQMTVKDLEKAGLNPMLAYMGQGGVGAASVPSGAAGRGADLSGIGSRSVANYMQAKMLQSSIALNVANAKKAESDANKSDAERIFIQGAQTAESGARSAHLGAQVREIESAISSMQWKIDREMTLLPTEIERLNADIESLKAGTVPKQLIGELGNLAMSVVRKLQEPETPGKAKELLRDTLNLIDDVNAKTWAPNIFKRWQEKRREDYRTRGGRLTD